MSSSVTHNANRRSAVGPLAYAPLAVVLLFPMAIKILGNGLPQWEVMWLLAGSVYASLKWLTFADQLDEQQPSLSRSLTYLLLWPGMNAAAYFSNVKPRQIALAEWLFVGLKTSFGVLMLCAVAPALIPHSPFFSAWAALTGLYFVLHSGTFHALALFWQSRGIPAEPLMHWPVLASSVSDYWGRRWNTAFRDLAQRFIFRPLVRTQGSARATMAVFLASGIVHDLVISVPAQGGWGLPTLYFLLQGCAVLLERSRFGRNWRLGHSVTGRLFGVLVILGPAPLLFHRPFLYQVILPMVEAVRNW